MPPLVAEPRGTALYCSRSTDTSCVGGGSCREKRSSGCAFLAVARFCAHRASEVRVAIALFLGTSRGPIGSKCPGTPLGKTHCTLLQTGLGSFSWTGAISRGPRAIRGISCSGIDFHRRGQWDSRGSVGSEPAAHNALPEGKARLPLRRPGLSSHRPAWLMGCTLPTPDRAGGRDRQHFHPGLGGGVSDLNTSAFASSGPAVLIWEDKKKTSFAGKSFSNRRTPSTFAWI